MKKWIGWLVVWALVFALGTSCYAEAAQEIPVVSDAYSYISLLDAQAMRIVPLTPMEEDSAITAETIAEMMNGYYSCLDMAGVAYNPAEASIAGDTMTDFAGYLIAVLEATSLPESSMPAGDAVAFLQAAGILSDTAYAADASMMTSEAATTVARAVMYAIEANGAGAKGLLWRVADEDTVLYLLGSIHMDDAAIYPFGDALMQVLLGSDEVIFELDFGDTEGMAYLQSNTAYPEGEKLSDHIPEEMVEQVLAIYSPYGVERDTLEAFRPWVLASEIMALSMYAEDGAATETAVPMVMDTFVYSKAAEAGIAIGQLEGYQYQTDLFNSLDDEVLAEFLQSSIDIYNGEESEDELTLAHLDAMLRAWRTGDLETFEATYDKDAQEDALSRALFVERDAHMTEYVISRLEDAGQYLVTVGAGHMVGAEGIIARLTDLGYDVEFVGK